MSNRPEKINLSDVHSRQVDIDLLNELRDLFVKAEEQKERYDFTWNGKAKAYFEGFCCKVLNLLSNKVE